MFVSYLYFGILFFLLIFSSWEVISKEKSKFKKIFFLIFALILIAYCGFRPLTMDLDIQMYLNTFQQFCSYSLNDLIFNNPHRIKEKGFILINKLFCSIGFRPMIMFFVILGMGIKSLVIFKKAAYPITALFLYVVLFLPLREYTQVRDAVASSFIIVSLFYFDRKNFLYSIILFLVALSFHFVSLIYIPIVIIVYFVKRDLYYILLALLGGVLFFLKPTEWLKKVDLLPAQILKYNEAQGTGSLMVLLFVTAVLLFYYYSKKYFDFKDNPETDLYVKLSYISIFVGLITYYHPVLSRLSNLLVFFSIILLSKLISSISNVVIRYLFIFSLVLFYLYGVRNFMLITGQDI